MRTTPLHLAAEYRASGAWSEQRLGDLFASSAAVEPTRVAIVDPPNRVALDGVSPRRRDWRSLSSLVDATMVALADAGVRRDDVLVTQLPNVLEYVAVYLACARLGVVISPVPMQFRRGELEPLCKLTQARALLTVHSFKGTDHAHLATTLTDGPEVLVLGPHAPEGTRPFAPDPSALNTSRAQALELAAGVHSDDIVTICWTSGTEGVPKGVPRSHNHWIAGSICHFDGAQIRPGDRLLNPFPLVNMAALGGCFMSWLRAAGTLILHHPFELPVYLQQIAQEKPQYAIAPPAVLMLLLQNEALLNGVDLSCLRCIGSGSAPLPPVMIKTYKEKYGIEIINNFGSNEGVALCSGPLEAPDPQERSRLFPRFGRPELDWQQRIAKITRTRLMDPQSGCEIVEPHRPGEMQIRGPVVFDGYFAAPEITARSFTEDGWFRTGDLFEIDASGRYYQFVGRLKQLINRGGVKISPDEIDAVLAEHPDVAEGAVVGYPDEVLGERICAVVAPKAGRTVTVEALQSHFNSRNLAKFKWPERVRIVERLPRNPVGKVIRGEVARIAAATQQPLP
ncbi:MAG TPA: class I adenylate-forming enzyme family protein [Steroidobacteraceae bacterium]|nr:class I adenylate-forming enzyme family protein [Steroidobacteraceae bacterium]